MTIGQSMLSEFDEEMQNTRKVLERCPDEKWNWKPHEKSGTLAGVSDADLMKDWTLLAGGQKIFTLPRIACIRGMCLNHLFHHRGQLTVYFRLIGVPVPGLYGPSADESQPGAAEAAAH